MENKKTAAQILQEHSPLKDAGYEKSWCVGAMEEYKTQALNESAGLLLESSATLAQMTKITREQNDNILRLMSEIESLSNQLREKDEFISEGLDRNDRFDRAEDQWYNRHQKDQARIKELTDALTKIYNITGLHSSGYARDVSIVVDKALNPKVNP